MNKILFIHHAEGWGGAPINMINIINSLDKSKYAIEVLLLKHSIVAEKLEENGIKYSVADSDFFKKYYDYFTHSETGYVKWFNIYRFLKLSLLWLLSRYYFAPKELGKHIYDIVHLNSAFLTDWLAPAKRRGKVVIHIQEPFRNGKYDILHPFFICQMQKFADRIIAISEDTAKRIGIPDKTEVIYNYANIPENLPFFSSYESKKFLYLGGATSIKGFYTLVGALDYLDKDVIVYFGGNYTLRKHGRNIVIRILKFILPVGKKKKKAIDKIKNHPNAIMLGMTNNIEENMNEICCLISPFSVPHFSRPIIEAHLHKKPAIGTDIEGMDEIIEHDKNGLIVPKNNPKELASAINALSTDPKKVKTLGENGYNVAIRKFTPENTLQFQYLYDKLVTHHKD
jgi:glycosyltransferase involved in cell wall biosynthesis